MINMREYMASVAAPVGLPLLDACLLARLYVKSAQIKQVCQRTRAVLVSNVMDSNLMGAFGLVLLAVWQIVVRLLCLPWNFLCQLMTQLMALPFFNLAMPGYMIICSLVLAFALFIPFHKKDPYMGFDGAASTQPYMCAI